MTKYRKKPVVVDAIRWDGANWAELHAWTDGKFISDEEHNPVVLTLEGRMHATTGDWIIRGVKGEFYPCKPDIFEATYEVAE